MTSPPDRIGPRDRGSIRLDSETRIRCSAGGRHPPTVPGSIAADDDGRHSAPMAATAAKRINGWARRRYFAAPDPSSPARHTEGRSIKRSQSQCSGPPAAGAVPHFTTIGCIHEGAGDLGGHGWQPCQICGVAARLPGRCGSRFEPQIPAEAAPAYRHRQRQANQSGQPT